MSSAAWFIIGLFVGLFVGVVGIAFVSSGRDD